MFQLLLRNLAVKLFGAVAELGFKSRLFHRGFLSFYSVYKTYLEAGPIDQLRQFVPSGSLVVDVGANVGFFSRRFASWVAAEGKVVVLEPEDRNFEALHSMLIREGLIDRCRLIKAAAAERTGKAQFRINPRHPGDHKLSMDETGIAVDVVRLDDVLPDKRNNSPSLIKIDVQGAELAVLRGAVDVLRRAKPALFVELDEQGLRKFGASVSAVLSFLGEFGYEPFWLEATGGRTAATQRDISARIARLGYVDVLFLVAAEKSHNREDSNQRAD